MLGEHKYDPDGFEDGAPEPVTVVTISPDGLTLASGGPDRKIRLWDVRTWQMLRLFDSRTWVINTLAFSL